MVIKSQPFIDRIVCEIGKMFTAVVRDARYFGEKDMPPLHGKHGTQAIEDMAALCLAMAPAQARRVSYTPSNMVPLCGNHATRRTTWLEDMAALRLAMPLARFLAQR